MSLDTVAIPCGVPPTRPVTVVRGTVEHISEAVGSLRT